MVRKWKFSGQTKLYPPWCFAVCRYHQRATNDIEAVRGLNVIQAQLFGHRHKVTFNLAG
jgi:hypothetical protein